MTKLPAPPPEIPAIHTVDGLAPKFLKALSDALADLVGMGWRPILRETLRTDERAKWLYGFGRDYDDGRGIVTNAPNALKTWHHYGLAADVGDRRYDAGSEPAEFFQALGKCAKQNGLAWGGDWRMADQPHVQWGAPMRVSPSDEAANLLQGGVDAVWRAVNAD